mmetsp:Transcript_20428/g.42838  ORF Transcript_20428/g.42838 Transcript_20428/m.42838 type:complete len:185 (+) Transcript_20428:762-1316(+)
MMIDAAVSEGGRPWGVQLLVIGQSALSQRRRRRTADAGSSLDIYTVDPSGGWRSCVEKGTAVGRGAERVASSILRRSTDISDSVLENESEAADATSSGWKGALDRAMMAAIDALEQDDESNEDEHAQSKEAKANYGAVVIFGGYCPGGERKMRRSKCAAVNPAIVEDCYHACCRKLMNQKILAK